MPEGDSLHRAARRLQPLVGERLEVEAPHPRAQAGRVAEQLDGRRLDAVEAVGKNLVLRFEGGVVLRSHLRMSGRWTVRPRGSVSRGLPWLVLRGSRVEGVLWNGPVLELHTRALARLGPDILGSAPDLDAMLARLRRADGTRTLGESLQDQTLVAGIGNMWAAETLWRVAALAVAPAPGRPGGGSPPRARNRGPADARRGRRGPRAAAAGARAGRPAVPALRRRDRRVGSGRRQPDRVLVPRVPAGARPASARRSESKRGRWGTSGRRVGDGRPAAY